MKSKVVEGQFNLLEQIKQGLGRERCTFDSTYPCTHFWAAETMKGCDNIDCPKSCCKNCKDRGCGYRCNASSRLKKEE